MPRKEIADMPTPPTVVVSSLPQGTALSRFVLALAAHRGSTVAAAAMAERWRDTPQVAATLGEWYSTKAATAPGTSTDATWAAPLAPYGLSREALALERGVSIIGRLAPKMRKVPFHSRPPVESSAGMGGAWVAEGVATPIAKGSYTALNQEYYKAAIITILSRELLRFASVDAELVISTAMIDAVAAFLDGQFLDPTITQIPQTRPASITNTGTAITSTGSTAAAIAADLGSMLAAISTAGGGLCWIARPTTAARIAAALGTAAADMPRTLFSLPMILSKTSPQQVTLVDANEIAFSDDGEVDVTTTDQAVVEMSDTPTSPPTAATVLQSLWELNLFGVRVVRALAYQPVRPGCVAYMVTTY
jgi:HK97 family phage major capsid protein